MAPPSQSTLLDLVQAVSEYATSEQEVVATVASLINSGKVLPRDTFVSNCPTISWNRSAERIELSVDPDIWWQEGSGES